MSDHGDQHFPSTAKESRAQRGTGQWGVRGPELCPRRAHSKSELFLLALQWERGVLLKCARIYGTGESHAV